MNDIRVHECTFSKCDEDGDDVCNTDGTVKLFTCHEKFDWSYIAESVNDNDLVESPDELTDKQKQLLRDVWKLGNYLADRFGEWQDDLAAVIETGEMISYQLDQAFPFLTEENTDELNK